MSIINKAPETMTSRERILKTFAYEKTDRVPIGYDTNAEINRKLCETLGIDPKDKETLYQALGVDNRGINPPYIGPQLHEVPPNRQVNQVEGCIMRWVTHETGGYWDFCDFPLKDAEDEDFEKFPIPDPDNFDYELSYSKAKAYDGKYALCIGGPGTPDILNSNGRIMGVEDMLCHLALGDEAAIDFMRRRAKMQLGVLERTLEKCKGMVDFVWLGEDLGTQIAPMISLELYRERIKPIQKEFADLAAAYKLPSIIHTCGSSSWAYEDFIEIGIKGVDTLQPEAANMSPEYLVEHFGGRLNFRGCISTAGPLAYGTAAETEAVCRETLETMMPYRGYHFAPTHAIQDNTPVENVIAMYNAAHTYGRY